MRRLPVFAVLAVAVVPAALSQTGGNLLLDPGAEAAVGATDSAAVAVPSGWTAAGSFTAVAYGAPGFPVSGSGRNFFAGGPGAPRSSGTQVVDVSSFAAAIDAGRMQATLSGLLGGSGTQADSATVEAVFRDRSGAPLSGDRLQIGPVTETERDGKTVLLPRSATAGVPAHTRTVEVAITAERVNGSYNDGYADDVSLTLQPTQPPAAAATKTYLWGGSAVAVGDPTAALYSETIAGSGWARARADTGAVVSAPGTVRITFLYRRPKARKRTLSLRSTGTAKLTTQPGGSRKITVDLRVLGSSFRSCHKGDSGQVTLIDGAGKTPDSLLLSVCRTRKRYVDGGPHQMRVRVTIGERR